MGPIGTGSLEDELSAAPSEVAGGILDHIDREAVYGEHNFYDRLFYLKIITENNTETIPTAPNNFVAPVEHDPSADSTESEKTLQRLRNVAHYSQSRRQFFYPSEFH